MAKFLKFFFEYQSLLGETHRVEIWEEGTTTATIELQAGAEPFVTENNNDVAEKYLGGIVPTVATVMMSATETFNSSYFSKQKYGDYILKFRVNGALRSNAIITPFEANDLDRNGGYPITLSAECGLRNLKNKKYTTTGTRIKLISVLKNCLAQIGFIDNFPIKVIDNTKCYDGSIFDAVPTKYWEAYCDDIDFEGLNCYEVIDRIRKPYNQVFFDHVNGCWFVRNVDEVSSHNSTITTYNWTDLSFTELSYNRPTKAYVDRQSGYFGRMFSHQSVVVKKAKSNMPIRNSWGKMDNLTGWTFSGAAGLFYVINGGQLYNSKASFSSAEAVGVDQSYVQSPQFLYTPFQTFAENEKLTIEADVKMGSVLTNLRMQIITGFNGPGGIPNFLSTDGNWYSVENDQVPDYEGGNFFGSPIYEVKPSGDKLKIEIPRPPYHANNEFINQLNQIGNFGFWNNPFLMEMFPENAEYYLIIRIFFPERGESESAGAGSTDAAYGLFIDNINIKVGNLDANISEGFERKFTLEDTQDRETDLTVDLGIGWPSYPTGTDSLFKTTADSSLVKFYSKSNVISGEAIDVFVSNSYLKVLGKRLQTYQGTIWESLGFGDLVGIMGVKYRLHNAKYNARMHNTEVKAVELATNTTSTIDEETLQPNEDEKLIEEKIDRAVNRIDIPEFSSVNFAKKVLPSGKSVIMMNPDMRMDSAFADKFYAKSVTGGIITTEAEDTDEDFLHIKPAANGTYALQEWVDATTWKINGNTGLSGVQYIGFGNLIYDGEGEIIGQESGDLGIKLFGNEIARFTEQGNFGVGIAEPSAVIHGHANVSGNADVVLLKATNQDINYFFSVSVNPDLNQIRINNSGTLRVRNTWQFDANAHFAINATTIDATQNAHVPNWGQVQALAATGIKFGEAVRSIATTNITLSGTQTINGYAALVGDRILVSGQTTASQNGVYIVSSGAWTRAADSDTDGELRNYVYPVTSGTFSGWKYKNSNSTAITVGTTAITYTVYDNNIESDPVFNAWRTTTQNKNLVYASSGTVDGAIPSFRSLLATDIPTLNQNTTGSAATLTTARTISATGDATWSVTFNGGANVSAALTLATIADSGVGSAFVKITRNTKGLITGTQAVSQADIVSVLGANAITNAMLSDSGVAAGTYRSVTVNAKGIVTAASNPTTVSGYGITDFFAQIVSGFAAGANLTVLNTDSLEVALEKLQGQINARISGNQTITLSGIITGSGTTAITTSIADSALSIAKTSGLQTALDSKQATLSGTGLVLSTAGTITYVTNNSANWNTAFTERNRWDGGATGLVAATGRASLGLVIGTDVQAYDADLQAIGALTGTSGVLRKTAANTWSLDTNSYLTANQTISITGDATGSGTTSIALTLANVATAGTYRSVTINNKGLVTSGTNPTTLAGYAITDAYTKTESDGRFVVLAGSYANPTWITSLAWSKLSGVPATFAPSAHTHAASDITSGVIATARLASGTASATTYLRGDQTWATLPAFVNQTITLSGIVTGSGTTAITTAIADNALSIAKTSGLQTALNSKQATLNGTGFVKASGTTISYDNTSYQPLLPSGNNGQFLVRNATNQLDFMNLVLEPQGLSYNKIAVGDNQNYLSEQQGFEFREESYIAIYKVGSNPIKAFYAGMYSSSNNSFITASGGSLTLKADNGFYLDGFTGSGNRMLAVDTFGRIYHTAIPTGGGGTAVGTLDQVLANGDSSNRNIILNYGGYVSTDKLQFSGESWKIYKRYDGGTGTGVAVSTLAGSGTRMVVADSNGVLSTQAIPTGGGSVGTIDQVLAAGNTAVNKTMQMQGGQISFANPSGIYVGNIKCETINNYSFLSLKSNLGVDLQVIADKHLFLLGENVALGYNFTNHTISMNGTGYNFGSNAQNSGSGQNANQWGPNFNLSQPATGDRILFYFDGTRFVPSRVRTFVTGGKTYLTID
ncbi:beta strand repeat-containing protein [Flavobacterium sp.]|jgi:phage-related tail fiber protein|uniref:beta strand repeat-containing protein n=1 Tax=Flavobacterium sp. TaxID=239 RepID=UPI0037BFA559